MKKTLLFGVLAAFAISAVSVQNLSAQNPVKTTTKTEKKVEKKADKVVAPENKIEKQSMKDAKPAQSSTVSDCCKPSNNNCDNTCKKKLSTTNASNQPNAAVKPKPQTQSQSSSTNNANDR